MSCVLAKSSQAVTFSSWRKATRNHASGPEFLLENSQLSCRYPVPKKQVWRLRKPREPFHFHVNAFELHGVAYFSSIVIYLHSLWQLMKQIRCYSCKYKDNYIKWLSACPQSHCWVSQRAQVSSISLCAFSHISVSHLLEVPNTGGSSLRVFKNF